MKLNIVLVATCVIVGLTVICILNDKFNAMKNNKDEDELVIKKIKTSKDVNVLNRIEHDDFKQQFMTMPVSLKRKLNEYEAMNYYGEHHDVVECTQKLLDETNKCLNIDLEPSFQTTPDVNDGTFMEGQKPVCHIDRVRAIESFSCPIDLNEKKINPCDKLCRHCVVGECKYGICH